MEIITSLEEGDMSLFKKQYVSPAELRTRIDELLIQFKENSSLKNDINYFMTMYNSRVGYPHYVLLKDNEE